VVQAWRSHGRALLVQRRPDEQQRSHLERSVTGRPGKASAYALCQFQVHGRVCQVRSRSGRAHGRKRLAAGFWLGHEPRHPGAGPLRPR